VNAGADEREAPWTILRVLDWTREFFQKRGIDSARLDAEVLLSHALGIPRVMLYARFDQPLAGEELAKIRALVARRGRREPIAQIVGGREFWSLDFEVSKDVLTPRPDTELLVEVSLERLKTARIEAPRIVDVGTGSGCVAIALAKELPAATVYAVDRASEALQIARRNAAKNAVQVRFLEGDLVLGQAAELRPLDLIAANLPYIRSGDLAGLMAEVRDFEPAIALDGGADGLDLIRRLVGEAPALLAKGGAIALEAGSDQLGQVAALLEAAGFVDVAVRRDYGGLDRVASGRRS
jgi:release factor glutamine methyltransferase